jgi:hypothetical protein
MNAKHLIAILSELSTEEQELPIWVEDSETYTQKALDVYKDVRDPKNPHIVIAMHDYCKGTDWSLLS